MGTVFIVRHTVIVEYPLGLHFGNTLNSYYQTRILKTSQFETKIHSQTTRITFNVYYYMPLILLFAGVNIFQNTTVYIKVIVKVKFSNVADSVFLDIIISNSSTLQCKVRFFE